VAHPLFVVLPRFAIEVVVRLPQQVSQLLGLLRLEVGIIQRKAHRQVRMGGAKFLLRFPAELFQPGPDDLSTET
jgi:hypothetical protein